MRGFVDDIEFIEGQLRFRGWAASSQGSAGQRTIEIQLDGRPLAPVDVQKELRPDVQRHLDLPHALVGYLATVAVDMVSHLDAATLEVHAEAHDGERTALSIAASARASLQAALDAGGDTTATTR